MADGRFFPGFRAAEAPRQIMVAPRESKKIDARAGDLLRIDPGVGAGSLALLAFGTDGTRQETALGLAGMAALETGQFDCDALRAWIGGNGGAPDREMCAVPLQGADEAIVLRIPEAMTVWVVYPHSADSLVCGETAGTLSLWHQPAEGAPRLPDPVGEVREEFTVPRGTARAYELQAGEFVQVIDVEGQQCSDFQALTARGLDAGLEAMIDSTATRSMVRSAFPMPGSGSL